MGTVISLDEAKHIREQAKRDGRRVVFSNGCFDVLHRGHVEYLSQARALGQMLMVGLNSDRSVRALKGPGRPVSPEHDRAAVLAALACVDQVLIFDELTPACCIETLVPDVLAKGGDWPVEKIVGREIVEAHGGQVVSIQSSVPEYSSSAVLERSVADQDQQKDRQKEPTQPPGFPAYTEALGLVTKSLADSAQTKHEVARTLGDGLVQAAKTVVTALQNGNKILLCGNGGSAADAQHIAAELVGRFQADRAGLPALALSTDTSTLTSVGNDYGFQAVFARQIQALAAPGDVLIAISTSGRSENVARGVAAATQRKVFSIGLLGKDGGTIAELVNLPLVVPGSDTARIQEAHITMGHILCEFVDLAYGTDHTSRA